MRSTFKVLFYVKKGSEKPNGSEVQLPPRYSRNGCKFLAKRFFFCALR